MSSRNIPSEHHVLRYAPWSKLLKDANETVHGILHTALQLRENEKYLSTTWIEYFEGTSEAQYLNAVRALRRSVANAKPKAGIARANVGRLHEICGLTNVRIRVVTERSKGNKAHAGIHRLPQDNIDLLEMLGAEAFNDVVLNQDIPT